MPDIGKSFLTQSEVDALIEGVTGPSDDDSKDMYSMGNWLEALTVLNSPEIPNLDKLRKAYEAAWVRHPYEWQPSSGMIDEVDGRFLALAFNLMHMLVAGTPKPGQAPLSVPKSFHAGGRP